MILTQISQLYKNTGQIYYIFLQYRISSLFPNYYYYSNSSVQYYYKILLIESCVERGRISHRCHLARISYAAFYWHKFCLTAAQVSSLSRHLPLTRINIPPGLITQGIHTHGHMHKHVYAETTRNSNRAVV